MRSRFRWYVISDTRTCYVTFKVYPRGEFASPLVQKRSMAALSKVPGVKEENQLLRPHRCAKYFKAPNHDASRRWWKLMSRHSNATMARRDRSSRNEMWENRETDDKSIRSCSPTESLTNRKAAKFLQKFVARCYLNINFFYSLIKIIMCRIVPAQARLFDRIGSRGSGEATLENISLWNYWWSRRDVAPYLEKYL